MSTIIDPTIPNGIYPTNDTIILVTVDTAAIFNATTQEEVIECVTFSDNQRDSASNDGPEYISNLVARNYVIWSGAVKDITSNPTDTVLIYDITNNSAVTIRPPQTGSGRTHVDGTVNNVNITDPVEYTVVFWVEHWDGVEWVSRGFQVDPKLRVHGAD